MDPRVAHQCVERRELPARRVSGPASLEEVIARRRSRTDFDAAPLTEDELAQLFWSGQGQTDSEGRRAAPSAARTYPLELYAAVPNCILHYIPGLHAVDARAYEGDIRYDVMRVSFGQPSLASAGAIFILAVAIERSRSVFGGRSERYVLLEAGHVAENVLLQATALGLRSTAVGNFDEMALQHLLVLPPGEIPVLLVAVGGPHIDGADQR